MNEKYKIIENSNNIIIIYKNRVVTINRVTYETTTLYL